MSRSSQTSSFYSLSCSAIDGKHVKLNRFRGKVILVVNTASKCHLRGQLADLQKLYQRMKPLGLEILAFPCNQFLHQENRNVYQINDCYHKKYNVDFPIFRKIKVNGKHTHPVFKHLKSRASGVFSTPSIKWNFTKFLISHDGEKVLRFSPTSSIDSMLDELVQMLEDKIKADKQMVNEKGQRKVSDLTLGLVGKPAVKYTIAG